MCKNKKVQAFFGPHCMALTSIGDTFTSLGDYQCALDYLEKGLDMFKRILLSEHTEIANTLMKFGYFYEKQSLIDRAIEYYHSGYEMATKTMTSDHPRLLEYFQDILHIYNKTNNIDQFIQFANKNLEFQRQSLGDIHPNIAKIHIIIGDLTKNNEQKLDHYKQALDILEKCLPINQEAILTCQNKITDATIPPNNYILYI
jgi:tetratricopeptide (TPR) repeat protein